MPRTRSAPDDGGGGGPEDLKPKDRKPKDRKPEDRKPEGGEPARAIDAALLEEWALSYLGRYATTAENLRQVLRRRVRRRLMAGGSGDREGAAAVERMIDALLARCRDTGLVNDVSYAEGRARRGVTQGRSLRRITAGLAAKGVDAGDAAAAIASLRDETADPELAAAIAFARRRRLGPFRRDPHPRERDPDRHRSELAAFARAGFPRRAAASVLACPDEAAVRGLLAGDEDDENGSGRMG